MSQKQTIEVLPTKGFGEEEGSGPLTSTPSDGPPRPLDLKGGGLFEIARVSQQSLAMARHRGGASASPQARRVLSLMAQCCKYLLPDRLELWIKLNKIYEAHCTCGRM